MENNVDLKRCLIQIEEAIEYASADGHVTAYNWNEALSDKTVVVFGTGKFFEDTHERLFRMVNVEYVCDNNKEKWGKVFYGKECIPPYQLANLRNAFVIIVLGDCRGVMQQLRNMHIDSIHVLEMYFSNYEKGKSCAWLRDALPPIERALKLFQNDRSRYIFTNVFCNKIYLSSTKNPYETFSETGEYFENGFWHLHDKEYFVDGGAYVGDTVMDFMKHIPGGHFEKVYSFEYEKGNYDALYKNLNRLPKEINEKIEVYCCGIWNKKEEGWCEYLGEPDGTQLMSTNQKSIHAQHCILDKLDNVLENKKVTTLKLDIEGAEIQGLLGAEKILTMQKPKLAICLYHRPEDMWEIPLLINKMNSDYKMIIKHHSFRNYTDTVLYAF